MRLLLALFVLALCLVPAAFAGHVRPFTTCSGCADGSGFPDCNDFNIGQVYSPDGGYTYYRCTFSYTGDYWARVN